MMDENDRYQEYFDYFSDQLSMDLLKKDYPYDSEMLDNILELIVETVCTKRPLIRIGAEERPAEIVRSRFMKLNAEHIRYVMDCFKENTTKIRNIRQYMLTTIYNAPTTIPQHHLGISHPAAVDDLIALAHSFSVHPVHLVGVSAFFTVFPAAALAFWRSMTV